MDYQTLRCEQQGPVLTLTLHRPEVRNAMSLRMVDELQNALRHAHASFGQADAVRVVVLQGSGGHFCAGGDLKDMAQARMQSLQGEGTTEDPIATVSAAFGQLCLAFAATPLALVAVLQGTVMGGGLGLACVADVVLADDSVQLRLPETAMGVVPAQIAPFLVERLGYSRARQLAVTGGRIDAPTAHAMGLVHTLVPAAQLAQALQATLADILACAPGALAATKALMRRAQKEDAAALVLQAAALFAQAVRSPEGQEGTMAFIQKRKPQWAEP